MSGMEIDYVDIGPSPFSEDCAQVGEPDFRKRASKEMDALINQMKRMYPEIEDHNVLLKKKWFNHDFGTYGSVVAEFFVEDQNAREFAYKLEILCPESWDDEARIELGLDGVNS